MFNGYVLYLQAVTTPNPFVKLPKLPFHKSLLLIFCLRLRFPFSFFKLFFAAVALVIFPPWLWLFFRGGLFFRRLWLFPTAALVIFPGWLRLFFRRGLFFRRLWLFPTAATLIILFWTYFYLYKKICPNNFYFWTYELQISLFMSKFHLNFAVFKHISVVLDLYSHFFGHKILFIPDYVQTPSITSTGLSNIHKLIYCTE